MSICQLYTITWSWLVHSLTSNERKILMFDILNWNNKGLDYLGFCDHDTGLKTDAGHLTVDQGSMLCPQQTLLELELNKTEQPKPLRLSLLPFLPLAFTAINLDCFFEYALKLQCLYSHSHHLHTDVDIVLWVISLKASALLCPLTIAGSTVAAAYCF